ncbi:hypothetical protein CALVIDRAFT_266651 [Calocera viscosa TUFC12733]|uniref:Uncharacterized protein n=1 Tax=Calocera viscosa (strain TUFC12733) TaxID=1330018 RepID=A0A167IX60_CALVF|nr:hypothetical protein CALVIDRAFT_266651 [Calocera viscosa TUFC12733]
MMNRLAQMEDYGSSLTGLARSDQSRRSPAIGTEGSDGRQRSSDHRARPSSDFTLLDSRQGSDVPEGWPEHLPRTGMVEVPPMSMVSPTSLFPSPYSSPFATPETPDWLRRVLADLDPEHPLSQLGKAAVDITPSEQDAYEAFLQKSKVLSMGDDAPYSSPIFSRPGPSSAIRMLTDLPSSSLPSQVRSQTPAQDTYAGPPPFSPPSSESRESYWTPVKGASQAPSPFIHRPTPRYATSASFIKLVSQEPAPSSSIENMWDVTPPITDELAALLDGDMSVDSPPQHTRLASDGETLFDDGDFDSQGQYCKPTGGPAIFNP